MTCGYNSTEHLIPNGASLVQLIRFFSQHISPESPKRRLDSFPALSVFGDAAACGSRSTSEAYNEAHGQHSWMKLSSNSTYQVPRPGGVRQRLQRNMSQNLQAW